MADQTLDHHFDEGQHPQRPALRDKTKKFQQMEKSPDMQPFL
jgi:hypothetical protein